MTSLGHCIQLSNYILEKHDTFISYNTLSQSQSKPLRNQTVSPRSEVPANIRGMNNSFTATPDLNNSMKLSKNKAFMDSAMRKLGHDNEQNFDKEVGFGE
jgi:hypothetical protein